MLVVFVGAWAFAALAGLALGWSRERVGALTLLTGLGNCTFIGYPLIEALRGREALALAVITDQFGLGPVVAIGGSLIAALYGRERAGPVAVLGRMLAFPPFIALLVALAVGRTGGWPEPLHAPLRVLGATMSPVALLWIGLRFQPDFSRALLGVAALGLGWKLLLAPLVMLGVGLGLGVPDPVLTVGVLQSAMAPMITGALLAERNGLEPALVHTVLGTGVPLGFVTVPLWNMLLG
jgi:predicted permease